MSTATGAPAKRKLGLRLFLRAMLSPVAFGAHALVEDEHGRILLARHTYTYRHGWLLPGGGAGRGEAASDAVIRELREEVGLTAYRSCELFGLYTRKSVLATNAIALFRVRGAVLSFRPNFEVREIVFADPAAPPPGTAPGVLRRLAELRGEAPQSPYW
jgi:ADP-ribose pyrophosphatase YjhB (NUDIX family)